VNYPLRSLTLAVVLSLLSGAMLTPELRATQARDQSTESKNPENLAVIPGPLRSFLRMAGISQKVSPEEVLPLLSYNIFERGYEGWQDSRRPVEFLILLERYVRLARELSALTGPDEVIRVTSCEQGKQLLRTLGYRLREECGDPHASAVTADAERAFLTIDSGFPLLDLEEALQKNQPFIYSFPASRVPVIFQEADWKSAAAQKQAGGDLVDILLHDPSLARLYWAMSRMDDNTRETLRQSSGLRNLLPYGPVLDFYGSQICVRAGRVVVPGGPKAEPAWKELVGASPQSPGEFSYHLISKDTGWAAAYFDALSRVSEAQQEHFTSGRRLIRDYDAFHSTHSETDAARQSFRPAPGLLILLTRLPWDGSGQPPVPGNLDAWKKIFKQKSDSAMVRGWERHSGHLNNPDQLLEAMFALSRADTDSGPLQLYLLLTELDSRRSPANQLHAETVLLLAGRFADFKDQYRLFLEFPELDDQSITRFVTVAESIDRIPDHTLRGNAMGMFQSNVGLWQILARQGQIPSAELNTSWHAVLEPFAHVAAPGQLFDAGQSSLSALLIAAHGRPERSQAEIVDLLAGPVQVTPDGQKMHHEIASNMQAVLDGQRLISWDTLQGLGNGLNAVSQGKPVDDGLLLLAKQLRSFEMPQPIFTGTERTEWASGVYNNRHTDLQMRTDLTKLLKSSPTPGQLQTARGQLAPFLRDFLVGLNYAYYQPPGAQVLRHNPLFVRSHDFAGETLLGNEKLWQAPRLIGEGTPAGGGAHFVGSLADLPYALASVEEDFLAPENVQALIWKELVPSLLVSSTIPRWWGVSPEELHAVTLQQKAGEELIIAAAANQELRDRIENIFRERMNAQRLARVEQALQSGSAAGALARLTPADTFYLAAEYRERFPDDNESWGAAGQELGNLHRKAGAEVDRRRLSRHFGIPHPTLAQNDGPELLNVRPFPAFEGYSSRLLAETWDSGNLYWARLADEMGYSPVMLNRLAPQLTRRMVEKIFATDFEDWDALLRAMRETGDEFRQGKLAAIPPGAAQRP
jgi:hypothetical protein